MSRANKLIKAIDQYVHSKECTLSSAEVEQFLVLKSSIHQTNDPNELGKYLLELMQLILAVKDLHDFIRLFIDQ